MFNTLPFSHSSKFCCGSVTAVLACSAVRDQVRFPIIMIGDCQVKRSRELGCGCVRINVLGGSTGWL